MEITALEVLQCTPPWQWPRNAAKSLLATLRDPQAKTSSRLVAADLAGEASVIDDDLAGALLSIVSNRGEPEELRAKAVISLGPALELADDELITADFEPPEDLEGLELFDDSPISAEMFGRIKKSLRSLYQDVENPKLVRRRILEASVRAPEDWHAEAIRAAYASGDEDWRLTAVFCMGWVRGFDEEIVKELESANPEIQLEAVRAAGNYEIDAAWPRVSALLRSGDTARPLLLTAIEAAGAIRPEDAIEILSELTGDEDDEISEAASEALAMAQGARAAGFDDEEEGDLFDDYEEGEADEEESDRLF